MFFSLSILIAFVSLFKDKWHNKAVCYLWWALFPFPFPHYAQKYGLIQKQWKSWLLVLVSPCLVSVYCIVTLFYIMSSDINGVPDSISYHNSEDLLKVTGVEFPSVVPVDSIYHEDWCQNFVRVSFVPLKKMSSKDFRKFDKACLLDSCCWSKDSLGYHYEIYPERPLDRTKGSHRRIVESLNADGTTDVFDDWDGDYVSVFVPYKGDTITLEDGWVR